MEKQNATFVVFINGTARGTAFIILSTFRGRDINYKYVSP